MASARRKSESRAEPLIPLGEAAHPRRSNSARLERCNGLERGGGEARAPAHGVKRPQVDTARTALEDCALGERVHRLSGRQQGDQLRQREGATAERDPFSPGDLQQLFLYALTARQDPQHPPQSTKTAARSPSLLRAVVGIRDASTVKRSRSPRALRRRAPPAPPLRTPAPP